MKPLTLSHDRLNQDGMTLKGCILITGGTGSLGTAILERAHKENWPAEFTVLARNEAKINQLRQRFPDVRCEIGDVRDIDRLLHIFPHHDLVIHAAAIKIIPVAELSPSETVYTNVIGSMNVARAAIHSGVGRVVGISSDKACAATTSYGASKFLMEYILREFDRSGEGCSFSLVRYGNILGSNASVLPLFRDQVRRNVPITLTLGSMSRFWLSLDEGIDLITAAATSPVSGTVRVPKAKASDMWTLARAVAPDPSYPITEMGKRPSEKIHEKMIHSGETYHTVDYGPFFIIYSPQEEVENHLPGEYEYCSNNCDQFTVDELREKIKSL